MYNQSLWYGKEVVNITDQVIQAYDKKYPVKKK
jgi:hypothetical protein